MSFFYKYSLFAVSYSAIRKIYNTYDTKYKYTVNNKIEEYPILYNHRIAHLIYAASAGIYITPFTLLNDIGKFEMYVRNIHYPVEKNLNKEVTFLTVLTDMHLK